MLTFSRSCLSSRYYKDAVNTNPFYGAKPRQAKIVSIASGEQKTEGDISYYEVAIRVAFMEAGETWDREILNTGMSRFIKDFSTGELTLTSEDPNANPINSPVKLSKEGTLLADDAEPVYLKFKTYPERNFNGLGI